MRITKRFNGNITDDKRKVLVELFGSDVKIITAATYFRIVIGDGTYKDNKDHWQITADLLDKLESELRTSKTQPYSNAVKAEIARLDRNNDKLVKRVEALERRRRWSELNTFRPDKDTPMYDNLEAIEAATRGSGEIFWSIEDKCGYKLKE